MKRRLAWSVFFAMSVCSFVALSGQPQQQGGSASPQAASCQKLASMALPNTTITSAQMVAAGALTFPPNTPGLGGLAQGRGPNLATVPEFCRIITVMKPVPASTIHMEVWLPSNWNGSFRGVANPLWAGYIEYATLIEAIRSGSAAAGSDTGHTGTPQTFPADWYDWQNHRDQVIDFESRSFHETALKAKALISAYYGKPITLPYLIHPSGAGSRMTMREVQQFPDDYDIVIAGGLATHQTHHPFGQQWVWQAVHKTPESYIQPEKYPAIHAAAMAACDMNDGVKDGVILDPAHCKFDPGVMLCKGADSNTCLTQPQVDAARQIYATPTTTDTKEPIFGPLMPGSELGWAAMAGPKPFQFGTQVLAHLAFKAGPDWDPMTLKFDSATVKRADAQENQPMNSWSADISKFLDRGGRLLLMGGWSDNLIAPSVNVDYYEMVVQKVGAKARGKVVLFMVPGMWHSPNRAGPRAYDIDLVKVVQQWKETGKAPETLVFTHYADGVKGEDVLVCAYPSLATYKGTGSTTDPANYACKPGARLGWEVKPGK